MDKTQASFNTQLFTVRVWREELGAGQREWRGEVHDVLSGERRYFREWSALLASLQALLEAQEPARREIGAQNHLDEQGDRR